MDANKTPKPPPVYPQDLTLEELDQRLHELWDPHAAEKNYQLPKTPQSRRRLPPAMREDRERPSLWLNRNQLIALWIGVAAETAALVYPPWIDGTATLNGVTQHVGRRWGWLWQQTENALAPALDAPVLAVECIMIAVIFVPLILLLKDLPRS